MQSKTQLLKSSQRSYVVTHSSQSLHFGGSRGITWEDRKEKQSIVSWMEKGQIWIKAKKPYPSASDEVRAP